MYTTLGVLRENPHGAPWDQSNGHVIILAECFLQPHSPRGPQDRWSAKWVRMVPGVVRLNPGAKVLSVTEVFAILVA